MKNQNCQLGFKWKYMIAKTLSFKMIPLMWPLLLQGTCYSLVYYCVSLWKNNTLVPPLTLVFRTGVAKKTHTVFALVLKNAKPWGKIGRSTFKFILPLILAPPPKKIETTTSTGVGLAFEVGRSGVWCDPVILKVYYFKNIWSDMHSKICLQARIVIF